MQSRITGLPIDTSPDTTISSSVDSTLRNISSTVVMLIPMLSISNSLLNLSRRSNRSGKRCESCAGSRKLISLCKLDLSLELGIFPVTIEIIFWATAFSQFCFATVFELRTLIGERLFRLEYELV